MSSSAFLAPSVPPTSTGHLVTWQSSNSAVVCPPTIQLRTRRRLPAPLAASEAIGAALPALEQLVLGEHGGDPAKGRPGPPSQQGYCHLQGCRRRATHPAGRAAAVGTDPPAAPGRPVRPSGLALNPAALAGRRRMPARRPETAG